MRHPVTTLYDIAENLGLDTQEAWKDVSITGVATLDDAEQGDLSFLANRKYAHQASQTKASVILTDHHSKIDHPKAIVIRVTQPYMVLAKYLNQIESNFKTPQSSNKSVQIPPTAQIHASAILLEGVCIEDDVVIGAHSKIGPGARILEGSIIGEHVIIDAGAVIGAEGFGWAPDEKGQFHRIPQLGNVILHNHVYIGANTTIDRAALGSTTIGEGTKIDNLCMIGHNVVIGKHTIIAAQSGVAGSTTIGDHCMIGGQVGIAGHLKIGNQVKIYAQSGVMSDIMDNRTIFGSPALDSRHFLKSFAAFKKQGE